MINLLKDSQNPPESKEVAYQIIHAYLEGEVKQALRKIIDEEKFSLPAWTEYHAFQLGVLKTLEKLRNFIPEGK